MKFCCRCKISKPESEFGKDKLRKDGLFPYCKRCRLRNPEKTDEIIRNRAQGLSYCPDCKQWLEKNNFYPNPYNADGFHTQCKSCAKKRAIDWKFVNPEAYKAKIHSRWWDNLEREHQRNVNYYNLNQEREKKRGLDYSKTPAGKARQARANHKRRVQNKENPATLTAAEWKEIIEEQNFKCNRCYKDFSNELPPTRDHIFPASKGGPLTRKNCQALCKPCNSSKGNR